MNSVKLICLSIVSALVGVLLTVGIFLLLGWIGASMRNEAQEASRVNSSTVTDAPPPPSNPLNLAGDAFGVVISINLKENLNFKISFTDPQRLQPIHLCRSRRQLHTGIINLQ